MALKRTLTATCDAVETKPSAVDAKMVAAKPCTAKLELDPQQPQVWLAVVEQGWIVDHLGPLTPSGDIPIYCPAHAAGRL